MPAAWELLIPQDENGNPLPQKFLAVLVPHTGTVSTEWCLKMKDLPLPVGSQMFFSRGMPLDVTRETMIKTALDYGFEWLLFLDADVLLPDKAIENLFSHKLPIINGMYKAKKPGGFFWGAWCKIITEDKKEAFAPIANWSGRVIEVDVVGCGCMLVHRSVFDRIQEVYPHLPLFFWSKDRNPRVLDSMGLPDPLMRDVSEDFWFCLLAKKCGFHIMVDTEIKCRHISTVSIGEDTVAVPGVTGVTMPGV